jgi:DNA invertase Pin-like site-specific DNA recombinase
VRSGLERWWTDRRRPTTAAAYDRHTSHESSARGQDPRAGDEFVVTKLDRLVRSLPDARAIADELTRRMSSSTSTARCTTRRDPVGRLLFNVLAMVAEFEADLIRARHPRRHAGRQGQRPPARQAAQAQPDGGGAPRRASRAGAHTVSELEELFSVARSTVYRG